MRKKLRQVYEVPITVWSPITLGWLEKLGQKYAKLVQWFITVFEREGWDFRNVALNHARKVVKEKSPASNGVQRTTGSPSFQRGEEVT